MKELSKLIKINKFKLDLDIFEDQDIVKFIDKYNLNIEILIEYYPDLQVYINHKDHYDLNWNGMVELISKYKIINPGLYFLAESLFFNHMDIENLKLDSQSKGKTVEKILEKPNQGYFITGNNGIGKTYFSVAFANLRYQNTKKKTLFVFWPDFVQKMKKFAKDSYILMEKIKHCKYLIIDDLGQESISQWSRDDLLNPIITYRLEKKLNTIITSNYEMKELQNLYTLREIEAKKIKSIFLKIQKLANPIEMFGDDYRTEDR